MTTDFEPVAITGYGCVFPPDGYDTESYWENLLSGRSGISTPPPRRWEWQKYYAEDRGAEDKTYCKFGGFVDDYRFPAELLGVDEDAVGDLNRTQLMILDTTLRAITSAGCTPERLEAEGTALFVGNMLGDDLLLDTSIAAKAREIFPYVNEDEAFRALAPEQRDAIEAGFFDAVHARFPDPDGVSATNVFEVELAKAVSRVLGLSGPGLVCDAACAAGLAVIDVAVRYLQDRTHHTVLASGALGNMSVTGNVAFAKIGGLSETHSAPLDASANGLIPGEGVGTVVLKRLDDAVRDGDRIAGVIRGIATRCDGKGKAIYAPSSLGQVSAMRRALELADVRPEELDHIETHATSTPHGDQVEVESLKDLFDGRPLPEQEVTLGSVKALTGHTFSAAGMANLIKVLLAFEHDTLPPTHSYTAPRESMDLEQSPFRVPTSPETWARREDRPRRVLSNAFGFGGVNSSVCLEQYEPEHHRPAEAEARDRRFGPLAVVGVGCVTPFAVDVSEFDEDRAAGAGVTGFPGDRWHRTTEGVWDAERTWRGGVIDDLDFPWKQYRLPPSVVAELDRSQLLAVMAAGQAFEDAGLDQDARRDAGVFIGATCGTEAGLTRNLRIRLVEYLSALEQVPEFQALDQATRDRIAAACTDEVLAQIPATRENALPGYMDNIVAGRICNLLDARGPGLVVDDDACSFGASLDIAARYLEQGECPVALVGGAHANLAPEFTELFARRIRESGQQTGELVPAEAAVFFVIKPLEQVGEDEYVHGVITEAGRASVDASARPDGEPFYFGAQGALQMLDAVTGMGKSGEARWVRTPQLDGGPQGYQVRLTPQGEEPAQGGDAAAEDGIGFVVGRTATDLLAELERVAAGAARPLPAVPADGHLGYRLGIAHSSDDELARKATVALKLLRSAGDTAAPSPAATA
ncbi:beta-ketoacyl synthase N-terminal-like domain-containing protein [Saccharopolyspora erythraea]|uniref:Multi-domain beta-ketoacyl synthase n=2 Tax=Saccharopolyspora erythraea TaxID=1836 RepID=A4FI69_SACEN|nr:beta-ketoacyl synthase N-terminal-like domain-containing protein [Saccharopolyspora erythraea]EQD86232.1 polyketide synthase [Saccharopolyspora erythraea D]QRK87604.1 polyketide synthase [Saccharopolyspora erythraea]CAM03744.1 multi-domain beta-ketoacyl synthase [Saccharopolyspora erythraea NRRL 2338]